MSRLSKNRLLLFVTALLFPLSCAWAEVPSGLVTFSFDRTSAPVYDLSGPYEFDQQALGAGGLPMDVNYAVSMENDTRGRLRGSGLTVVKLGDNFVAANYTLSGKVSRASTTTRATISVRLTGQDAFSGVVRRFSVAISYALEVDPESTALVGKARGKVQISGMGSANIRTDVSFPLPPQVDGAWTLQMDITPLQRLGGTGTIAIDNYTPPDVNAGEPTDRVLNCTLTGSYSSRQNLSSVSLSGYGESRPTSLGLKFTVHPDGSADVVSLHGTVLGQAVRQ